MNELAAGFDLSRWLDIVAPGRGALVAMWEAYFDESDSEDEDGYFTLAGYVFDKEPCIALDQEWGAMLNEYELPFFRMSACAHGNWPFDQLSAQERDDTARKAISIIKRHMLFGVTVSIGRFEYASWMPLAVNPSEAYIWCCYQAMMSVRSMANEFNFDGPVAYVFETGHQHQAKSDRFMAVLAGDDNVRQAYRYASHSFVNKRCNRPVQTADILAWHVTQMYRRNRSGKNIRRDYEELVRDQEKQYISLRGSEHMFTDISLEGWQWFRSQYLDSSL